MKKKHDRVLIAILKTIAVVSALIALGLMCGDAKAKGGIAYSWEGTEGVVTLQIGFECDSARAYFMYPDFTHSLDTVMVYPTTYDSTLLYGTGLNLVSFGIYRVLWNIWAQGAAPSAIIRDTSMWMHSSLNVMPAISPSLIGKTCNVAVNVRNNSGQLQQGITVTAYIVSSGPLRDSSGAAVTNPVKTQVTNSSGQAVFTCFWSSYLIPESKWRFSCSAPNLGTIRKDYTVPRQDTVTLDLR